MMDKYNDLVEWINKVERVIKYLSVDEEKAIIAQANYKVASDSLLGTIIYKTGGLVFENWVRVYGSGELDITNKNENWGDKEHFIVAEDILGGIFSLCLDNAIWYFAPDNLEWEPLEITYFQFIQWLIEGDIDTFYDTFRWKNWKSDTMKFGLADGVAFYPFLWTFCESFEERNRKVIPIDEVIGLQFDFKKQLS